MAGIVALVAPCCISVLLPTYAAAVAKERRRVLSLSLVYGAGVAAVLLPIGLGAAALAQTFRLFHQELYLAGGMLMLVFAALSLQGKSMGIPLPRKMLGRKRGGVFLLGVFSGAATSCCAPVLAGAMTLAVVSGTFFKSLFVVFAYIFGMMAPLVLAGYAYDKFRLDQHPLVRGRSVRVFGTNVHTTNLAAAALFALMGTLLLALGATGNAFFSPEAQAEIGVRLVAWSQRVFTALSWIPDAVWGIGIAVLFVFLLTEAYRKREE